jgi:hypothetical protein
MSRDVRVYLEDILEFIRRADSYVTGADESDFGADTMMQDICRRRRREPRYSDAAKATRKRMTRRARTTPIVVRHGPRAVPRDRWASLPSPAFAQRIRATASSRTAASVGALGCFGPAGRQRVRVTAA